MAKLKVCSLATHWSPTYPLTATRDWGTAFIALHLGTVWRVLAAGLAVTPAYLTVIGESMLVYEGVSLAVAADVRRQRLQQRESGDVHLPKEKLMGPGPLMSWQAYQSACVAAPGEHHSVPRGGWPRSCRSRDDTRSAG
jgi:hypothetical protein